MMMKSLTTAILLSLVIFFNGCDNKPHATLNVGISPWPGYEPLALAAEKLFYDESDIRIIRFATPTESYRALRDGIIDVAAFTADEVFHYAEVRDKPRIFLVLDISNGADAIVARKSIKTLDDLKGKRLGVEGSALGDYVINRSLDFTQGLKLSDMTLKHVEINEQERAFKDDQIDAAVTYEPSKSLLINAGAHVLFDSSKIPYEIVDVLVTNEATITERSDDLRELAKGWFKTLAYINANYAKAMDEMAVNEATTTEEFQKGYEDLIIPSEEENIKMLSENGTLLAPMQKLSLLMLNKGSLEKHIDVKPLLHSSIIKELRK